MKLQCSAPLPYLFILFICTLPFLTHAQDTSGVHKTQAGSQKYVVKDDDSYYDYNYWENRRLHAGLGVSVGFINAKGSADAALAFALGVDVLKYKWYALSVEMKPEATLVSSKDFAEFPLVAEHNFNFGVTKYNEPVWGFYFGGGISYVVDSYLKTTGDANSANFWGYVINGGIRINHFDIGLAKVTPLRSIDQIANPALYEIILSARF